MGTENQPVRVAVVGLGQIGRQIARNVLRTPELSLVAAVDTASELAGKPLSELVAEAPKGVRIETNLAAVLKKLRGGVLLHATGSRFEQALPQLEAAARAGVHVVSTCEELAFPWLHYEAKADALSELAAAHESVILGTGVNPGFVLDRLVATAGAVCGPVAKVKAERVVDAAAQRESLRRKVGVGLSAEEFEARADRGEVGHVGLLESAALAALGLGLDIDESEDELVPVIAQEDLGGAVPVAKGKVAGIFQRARGFFEGREVVSLELTIACGVDESFDRIELEAEPKVALKVEGGYAAEAATAWAVVNAASRVVLAEPGILTVLELPAGR